MTTRILLSFVIVVVITAVTMGLIVLGSPVEERTRLFDQRRVQDLQDLSGALNLYWTRHDRLPSTLDELSSEPGVDVSTMDPATTAPYEYLVLGDTTYQICASFERDSADRPRSFLGDFWAHGVGRHCFEPRLQRVAP